MTETHRLLFGDPTGPYAQVVADSVSSTGRRLTTMEVQTHRFVLAEFNTHRAFSRNSASSRAIPLAKTLERVRVNPAVPLSWPAEQRGMQGGAELDEVTARLARGSWLRARDEAISEAEYLGELGVHKSVANRLLEPFLWHRVIVSSTGWENFFVQRCSPLAQPEIRVVAEHMREALAASVPVALDAGEWHLPYVEEADARALTGPGDWSVHGWRRHPALRRVSAARCARVSYLTHDGQRDLAVDEGLYERLVNAEPPHWSPLEHVATPERAEILAAGNFDGWTQLRHHPARGAA